MLKKTIEKIQKKPKNLLDFGCGYGSMLYAAKRLNIKPYAYDINMHLLNFFKQHFSVITEKKKLISKKNFFDVIVVNKVLNLSPNIEEDFSIFKNILKTNGFLVLIEQVKDFSRYKTSMTKKNNNTHLLTVKSIKFFSNKFNLKIIYLKNFFGDVFCLLQKTNQYQNKKIAKANIISLLLYQLHEKIAFFYNIIYVLIVFMFSKIKHYRS